ncbi:hypothetical protein LCGC14_2484920 [marine sediment metagenome]|uniref:Uncharacterized protein n=1 Tax=marine sediment metagenome TaxID=412755 RepID=A0A0F9B777_9ZZZZ
MSSNKPYVSPLHRPVLYKRLDWLKAELTTEQLFKLVAFAEKLSKEGKR